MRISRVIKSLVALTMLIGVAASANAQSDPLYYLYQPGTEYSNTLATGPAATVFNGTIYIAYMGNGTNTLYIATSSDGVSFTPGTAYPSIQIQSYTGVAIATWNSRLWIAYTAPGGYVNLISSSDGVNFSSPTQVYYSTGYPLLANSQPTIVVFNNLLFISAEVNGSGTTTYMETVSTGNGLSFTTATWCGSAGPAGEEPQTGAAIGMAVFNNLLYFAFQAQGNWSHELLSCSTPAVSGGGYTWNVYNSSNPSGLIEAGSGISAMAYDNALYFAFKELSGNNNLIMAKTSDGSAVTWNMYSGITTNGRNQITPSAFLFGTMYYLAYTQNSSSHYLFVTEN